MAHRKLKSDRKNRPGGALQLRLSSTVSAPRAHDCLCEAYPNGLLLQEGQDYAEQIDEVIKQRSSSICSLISLEIIVSPEEINHGRYHYFVRRFAGDGAPEVDNTFITSHDIHGLQVNYKMA
jgi:hypothetical protein